MANEVVMPRLGWTMETGRVVEWLKSDGDEVEAGDFIFSVETDKAITEVESLDSGVLRIPPDAPEIGVEVAVGAMLAYILAPGESLPAATSSGDGSSILASAGSDLATAAVAVPSEQVASGNNGRQHRSRISPRARRAATSLGIDWTTLVGSGSSGRIREQDVLGASSRQEAPPSESLTPRASPGVRRLAQERGISLGDIPATGPGGRVTRADVRAVQTAVAIPPGVDVTLSPIRRITAQRMAESARTAAPVTLTTEADATDLLAIRARINAELAAMAGVADPVPSVTDLLVKLSAQALTRHPDLNASFAGDRIIRHADVHIGVAVDSDRGLLAPVIRKAAQKSLHAIAEESAHLIAAARAGTAALDELQGGTFTISNLGMFEIDAFTPIINLPECAVLGVGRVVSRPVVIDEETEKIAVRKMLALSLTFDHRVVDGAPAARFLQALKGMIERPYGWLMR